MFLGPCVERWRLPPDGRRRSRVIIARGQLVLAALLLGAAALPGREAVLFSALLLAALVAASVDVACDGMAVDLLHDRLRGWGNSMQVGGGYVGVMLGGSGFLLAAYHLGWRAALMGSGLCVLLLTLPLLRLHEPGRVADAAAHRPGLRHALVRREVRLGLLLALVLGAGIRTASGMLAPLLIDCGLGLEQLGWLLGLFSSIAGFCGTFIGGLLVRLCGAWRAATVTVAWQAGALGLLAWFASLADVDVLTALLAFLFSAMAAGFVAIYSIFMGLSSPRQAGVDFTLFQCADAFIAMTGGVLGGWLAESAGYTLCFGVAAGMSAAGAVYVCRLAKHVGSTAPNWR